MKSRSFAEAVPAYDDVAQPPVGAVHFTVTRHESINLFRGDSSSPKTIGTVIDNYLADYIVDNPGAVFTNIELELNEDFSREYMQFDGQGVKS